MIKKVLWGVLAVFIVFITLVMVQSVDPVQVDPKLFIKEFQAQLNEESIDIDSLRNFVGDNKFVPKGFELPALLALAAYPELKGVHIELILTTSGAPMESNFDFLTLLGPKKSRVYKVWLNDASETEFDPILLRSLPLDAQVGILAHELGHIAYYERHSTLEIAKFGILYFLSSDFNAKHERSTDLMPIYHGLGSQIHQYAYYVRHDESCAELYEEYKEFIDRFYMTDVELKQAWDGY